MSIGKAILRILGLVTLGDYEKMVDDNLKANTELSNSAGEAQAQAATLRQTANQYQARINELSSETADLTAQVEASDKRVQELITVQDELKETIATLEKDKTAIKENLDQFGKAFPLLEVKENDKSYDLVATSTGGGKVTVRTMVKNKANHQTLFDVAKTFNTTFA